jgi:hypothetical protein
MRLLAQAERVAWLTGRFRLPTGGGQERTDDDGDPDTGV